MEWVIAFGSKVLLFADGWENAGGFSGTVRALCLGGENLGSHARFHGSGTFTMITSDTCCNGFANVGVGLLSVIPVDSTS